MGSAVLTFIAAVVLFGQSLYLAAGEPMELRWSGVTPGEISAPVTDIWISPGTPGTLGAPRTTGGETREGSPMLVVATEDRHLRVYNPSGEVVRTIRTGFRGTPVVIREHRDLLILLGDRGQMVRVDVQSGSVVPLGTVAGTISHGWRDAGGNIYLIADRREMLHVSAAGTLLWRRHLPAHVRDAVDVRGEILVALSDGSVFRFDETGSGTVVYRGVAVREMRPGGSAREDPVVGIIDQDSFLHILRRQENGMLTVMWSREVPRETRLYGSDTAGHYWLLEDRRTVRILTAEGEEAGRLSIPGVSFVDLAVDSAARTAFVVDSAAVVRRVSPEGVVLQRLDLGDIPLEVTFNRATGLLVFQFSDWRYEVFGRAALEEPGADQWSFGVLRGASLAEARRAGARGSLAALAQTALGGTSRREREALLQVVVQRLDSRELYGNVAAARQVLGDLLSEGYRAPRVDRGRVANDFPGVRLAAVEQLARFLDHDSRRALTDSVRHDPVPLVVSRALHALAPYPRDEFLAVDHGMQRFRQATRQADRDVLAEGIIAMVESLPLSRETIAIAVELSSAAIPGHLRQRALAAVRR